MYNKDFKATKQFMLEPTVLESFQKIFDPNAPNRCRECNAQCQGLFCSKECEENMKACCKKCGEKVVEITIPTDDGAATTYVCTKCDSALDTEGVTPCFQCCKKHVFKLQHATSCSHEWCPCWHMGHGARWFACSDPCRMCECVGKVSSKRVMEICNSEITIHNSEPAWKKRKRS